MNKFDILDCGRSGRIGDSQSPIARLKTNLLPIETARVYKAVGDVIADALADYVLVPYENHNKERRIGISAGYGIAIIRIIHYFGCRGFQPADLNTPDGHEAIASIAAALSQPSDARPIIKDEAWMFVCTYAFRALKALQDR